jgi:hypothetical protein
MRYHPGIAVLIRDCRTCHAGESSGDGRPVCELTAAPAGLQDGDCTGELWEIRAEYRMNCFDLHVDAASGIIRVFGQRGIAMDEAWDTLADVENLRDDLDEALAAHDAERLGEIYGQRKDLWTELRATIRSLARGDRIGELFERGEQMLAQG